MEFVIDGEKIAANQGDLYFIPAGVEINLIGSDEWTVYRGIFNPGMHGNEIYSRHCLKEAPTRAPLLNSIY